MWADAMRGADPERFPHRVVLRRRVTKAERVRMDGWIWDEVAHRKGEHVLVQDHRLTEDHGDETHFLFKDAEVASAFEDWWG